ncbi:tetratricopeptide repeat protein [Corallococcus exercitus]|uniref:tetratricopeptide repeat protein n=1 Tax=Corallococcus exercitus TaxID=2316736 RepID=UPI0035D3EEC1
MSAPSTSRRQGVLLLGGIGVCAVAIVGAVRMLGGRERVLFVNGLDSSVTVTAGKAHFTLPANDYLTRPMPVGPLEVDIQGEGGTWAHETVFVTDEGGLFVYNVLGAAPLYTRTVLYSRNQAPGSVPEPAPQLLAGTSFQRVGRIDYVLAEPPKSLTSDESSGKTTSRIHLGMAPGGWTTSASWLFAMHRTLEGARLVEGLSKALPELPGMAEAAPTARSLLAREEGPLASLAISRVARDARPDDFETQRMWMHDMRRAGRGDELRAYYRAALEREPGSVVLAVLLARVEPGPEATARLEALVRAHPGELLPRRALAVRYARLQRWADALPLLEAMERDGDPDYPRFQDTHAETLVALGRREEAVRRLSERLLKVGATEELHPAFVELYAKVVGHSSQAGDKNATMRQLVEWAQKDRPQGLVSEWLAASLGEPVNAAKLGAAPQENYLAIATRVLVALAEEPEVAARACAQLDHLAVRHLSPEAGLLLAAEFERLGDPALAARMLDVFNSELNYGELQDVVSGKLPVESLDTLDWGERAALHLVLARKLDARGADSKAAYARVKKEALLPGPVTIALERWERPKPSGAVAGDTVP